MEIISRGITVYDFTFQVYSTAAKLWQTMISIKKYSLLKMLYYDALTLFNSVENKKRWEEMYFSEDNVLSIYLMKMSKIGKNKQHLAINMNTLMGSETHILCSVFLLLFLFSFAYRGYGCWIWAIRWQTTLKLHQFAAIFTLKMFFFTLNKWIFHGESIKYSTTEYRPACYFSIFSFRYKLIHTYLVIKYTYLHIK